MRYRSNLYVPGVAVLAFVLSLGEPEARAWQAAVVRTDFRMAQRKPWADEVMEAIGRRPSQSPKPPAAQPGAQGRDQPGGGARDGGALGIRGGASSGGEGRERGRSERQPDR